MSVTPASFRAPMVRLCQAAMARGALPVRSWEASSAKAVSRTWRRASMCRWSSVSLAGTEVAPAGTAQAVSNLGLMAEVLNEPDITHLRRGPGMDMGFG